MHRQPAATERHPQTRIMDSRGRIYTPRATGRKCVAAWWRWLRQQVRDWA